MSQSIVPLSSNGGGNNGGGGGSNPGRCSRRLGKVLYLLDILGVMVFALSGALAAGDAGLDLLGVLVIASVTAIGGGTIRDLLMNRHPLFWMDDHRYLYAIGAATAVTVGCARAFPAKLAPVGFRVLLTADAVGLGLFAMTGAQTAERAGLRAPVVCLMGTLSGVGGGLVRDVLTAQVPLLLRRDIYASAAVGGIALYLLLQRIPRVCGRPLAFAAGLVCVVTLRLLAVKHNWQLPAFDRE